MVIRIACAVCCFTMMFSIAKNHYSYKDIVLVSGFESKNSFISYITIDGAMYLLKQKKTPSKQFSVVRDAFAAWIAEDLHIAHSVEIIPPGNFSGKNNAYWPATLHTIARGKTIRDQPESKFYNLYLKQRLVHEGLTNRWLTEKIIYQMTWHIQLPIIIGLDLFICNTDRHKANIFYDPETDTFCAIDMDNIFRRDLPALAIEKLKLMIKNHKQFTKEEIEALASMRDTIKFLLDKHSVKQLINKLHFFVKQAGFTSNSRLYTEKITKKLARHERTIIQIRASAYKLISLLNTIIDEY